MKKVTMAVIACTTINISASEINGCFPNSELRYSSFDKMAGNISKNDYLKMQEKFKSIFDPILNDSFKKTVFFHDSWDEDKVNAYCTRDEKDNPIIKILGGMARHPDMTLDGLYLLACHELGHFLGGAPRAFRGNSNIRGWSSAEGQADYFATSKCLPTIFSLEKENEKAIESYPYEQLEKARSRCKEKTSVCIRMALASFSLSNVFHSLKSYEDIPDFDKKDNSKVYNTYYGHPSPQCRLDTLLSGANCKINFKVLFDPIDPNIGACHEEDSRRPFCWYLPEEKFI